MRRRVLMTGGFAGVVAVLAGCGRLLPSRTDSLNDPVEASDRVTSSEMETSGGGTMRTSLRGDIHFDVGQDQLLEALDPVWREVTEYVFELDDGFGSRTVLVTVHGADGSTVEPRELLGGEAVDQFGSLAFIHFFEHYGLA